MTALALPLAAAGIRAPPGSPPGTLALAVPFSLPFSPGRLVAMCLPEPIRGRGAGAPGRLLPEPASLWLVAPSSTVCAGTSPGLGTSMSHTFSILFAFWPFDLILDKREGWERILTPHPAFTLSLR